MELQRLCMGCMEEKGHTDQCPSCGFSETSAPESPYYLQPRTVLQDKYLIGRVLGQGGFAITYLAWDMNLSVKLAIKEYFPVDLVYRNPGNNFVVAHSRAQESIFANDMSKFLEEARILARFMEQPNIVSVTDFFQANRTAYLVMHYIEGITLRSYLSRSGEKLPFDATMNIMIPVMDALRAIHNANLLHRDISPENIIISNTGRIILIDFGAARISAGGKEDNLSVIMKPGYTPEEQYRTKGSQGPSTDIYAIAATIYRSITGQMPPNSLDRVQQDTLVPPSQLGIKIEPVVEKALLKALAVKASDRFQNVLSFQEALMQRKIVTEEQLKAVSKKERDQTEIARTEIQKGKTEPGDISTVPAGRRSERAYTTLADVRIGRAPDNQVVLDDETASRYHALIYSRYGKWYIADLDSTHGTFVNDQKIEGPVELIAPVDFKLSESILHFDGKNITNNNGIILHTLNEHISFTERWFASGMSSANRLIDSFLASLDSITTRRSDPQPMLTLNVGRAEDNDLVLQDDMVSRYHVRLFTHSGNWYLADLQSTHGTKVNDISVEKPVQLKPSDIIEISEIILEYDGKSILSEDGEVIYNLPELNIMPVHDNVNSYPGADFLEKLNIENIWIVVIILTGMIGIILLLIALSL